MEQGHLNWLLAALHVQLNFSSSDLIKPNNEFCVRLLESTTNRTKYSLFYTNVGTVNLVVNCLHILYEQHKLQSLPEHFKLLQYNTIQYNDL